MSWAPRCSFAFHHYGLTHRIPDSPARSRTIRASAVGLRHPAQQRANIFLRDAPILTFAPFKLFVLDSSAKSLKCVGKAERIIPQIFVDLSFDQTAMRTLRACQDTQSGQAGPEPRHVSSCRSPLYHERCCKPSVAAMDEQRRFNVNRDADCKARSQRDEVTPATPTFAATINLMVSAS
jgi:hypothetical protein